MEKYSYLKDKAFLKALDEDTNKTFWVKIEVLDSDELTIESIEGRVQTGSSINLNGASSVRRTCNLNFIALDTVNDLTNIENLLSANKKIKIYEGLKNNVNKYYDDIIWFPLGVFVIIQPSVTHTVDGCFISLSCKDKMCLLNGECAGNLPTSIVFDTYKQVVGKAEINGDPKYKVSNPNNYTIYHDSVSNTYWSWTKEYGWKSESNDNLVGSTIDRPQLIYDIIQTLVCNYGKESLSKIFINDIPLEIKQIVRYTGSGTLYYNTNTGVYTLNQNEVALSGSNAWRSFGFNDEVGYVYTDFIYPGSLVSNVGENVCGVLDKIKNTLGNYEYFYDVEGNFVFQEIKNYLNNSYTPLEGYRLDNNERKVELASNGLCILDGANYEVDFYSNTRSVYTFTEGNGLISSYGNTPNYNNLKNDFHIWGENVDDRIIHYHIAIRNKPIEMRSFKVMYIKKNGEYTGGIRLTGEGETPDDGNYIPADWRAELYLEGLEKQQKQQRPDIYEQELLDLFDTIYDFKEKKFKTDLVESPNDLIYFIDYLEPINKIYDCSTDVLGTKIYSYQENKIKKIYNTYVPNIIMLDIGMDAAKRQEIISRCQLEGQPYSNVNSTIYSNIGEGVIGNTAENVARSLLYQYTNYNESITISSLPIYYLDVNTRITVQDEKSGIYGDYIINSISLPFDAGGSMSINASRALERI